jgi:hypothetical protein
MNPTFQVFLLAWMAGGYLQAPTKVRNFEVFWLKMQKKTKKQKKNIWYPTHRAPFDNAKKDKKFTKQGLGSGQLQNVVMSVIPTTWVFL